MRNLLVVSCVLVASLKVVEASPILGFFFNLGDEISDIGDVVVEGVSDAASSVGEEAGYLYDAVNNSPFAEDVRDTVDDGSNTIGGFFYSFGDFITG